MVKQAYTHRMRVSVIDFTCKIFTIFILYKYSLYLYFEIFIVVNRPYFVPHTIRYNVFKFSTVPLCNLTPSHTARDSFMN